MFLRSAFTALAFAASQAHSSNLLLSNWQCAIKFASIQEYEIAT
jgi:hypothetical protein